MRLGHLNGPDGPRLFAEQDGRRIMVQEALPASPRTVDELISAGDGWVDRIGAALDGALAAARAPDELPAAPLAQPRSIVAIGLNYLDHCREFGTTPPEAPVVFAKMPQSVSGDGAEIRWSPAVTREVDWEAELAVVIGRRAREVSVEDALDAVFGYTVVNDVTARDIQRSEQQWIRAKSLDTFCPLGPVIVPASEIPDPQALRIRSRVNGTLMQDSSTAEMIFPVAEIIAYLSRSFTLEPGDVIATGTPLGVGAFRSPPVWLQDGDLVEVEIEGIGALRNRCRVTSPQTTHDEPEAR